MKRSATTSSQCLNASERAFALTMTLIIVALAAIVVVAFLTTTSTERTTAAAYGRMTRANGMADAGIDAAIAKLLTELKYRPYNAIGYRALVVGNFGNPAVPLTQVIPVITGPRTLTPGTTATYNSPPVPTEDVYLISTLDSPSPTIPGSSPPTNLTSVNSIDLNANHLATEPRGWLGSPVTAATPVPFRAAWIDVLVDPAKPAQPDPSQGSYNPVIGRYAYWIEDETSKLDVSIAGNKDGVGGSFLRGEGIDLPYNAPPKLAVTDLDIGTLPLIQGSPTPSSLPPGDTSSNKSILDFRAALPMVDERFLNRVGGQVGSDVHETTKFYETSFAMSNDLAGNGRRRANINALVTNQANPTTAVPTNKVAANIDDIAYVISGKHLAPSSLSPIPDTSVQLYRGAPDSYLGALSTFGTRFWTSPTPTTSQQNIYLEKVAANIRDYIDTDSQPTIIDVSGSNATVRAAAAPTHPIETSGGGTSGPSEIAAIGKERVPFAQEYALRVRQVAFGPRTGAFANYTIDVDHYVEFWNISNRDIPVSDLGPNPFLLIANQPGWDAGGLDDIPSGSTRDLVIPLSSVAGLTSFPAGSVTVITTDPNPLSTLAPDSTRLFSAALPTAKREYSGRTQKKSQSELRLALKTRTTTSSDYETEVALGNDFGILESAWGAAAISSTISVNVDSSPPENHFDDTHFHFRGGSLRGNTATSPLATTGDPRTNPEQLNFDLNGSAASNDKTRYFDTGLDSTHIPGNSTLTAPNANYVRPANWPDPSTSTQSASGAPAVILNASITSVGQLGDIFDPARVVGDSNNILLSRGGGRTLKIGQPDDLAGTSRFTSSWFNSAWRLTDLFEAQHVSQPLQPSEKVAPPASRGKININGVLRDSIDANGNLVGSGQGGLALRAAFRSFVFDGGSDSDPSISGQALPPSDVDQLISSIQGYLKTNGPMMERGEISQLSFFAPNGTLAGNSIGAINDRGREEIFRRTIEMITTRSASFTVYVVGEAIQQDKNGVKTTVAQKRSAVTFQLEPQMAGAPLGSSGNPWDAADSYKVKKLYAPN